MVTNTVPDGSRSSQANREEIIKTYSELFMIPRIKAEKLVENGLDTLARILEKPDNDIKLLGFSDDEVKKIKDKVVEKAKGTNTESPSEHTVEPKKESKEEEKLLKWLSGEDESADLFTIPVKKPGEQSRTEQKTPMPDSKPGPSFSEPVSSGSTQPREHSPQKPAGTTDVLKKWLKGEDINIEDWLAGEESGAPSTGVKATGSEVEQVKEVPSAELKSKELELQKKEEEFKVREREIDRLKAEYEALHKSMTEQLTKFKIGGFDVLKIIEENANLNKDLVSEIKRRKQIEEELEHVKKGSIAVIKYIKSQQIKGKEDELNLLKEKFEKVQREKDELEIKNKAAQEEIIKLKEDVLKGIDKLPKDAKKLKEKELELVEMMSKMKTREEELAKKFEMVEKREIQNRSSEDSDLRAKLELELRDKERVYIEKENEYKRRIIELEEENQSLRIEQKMHKEASELRKKSSSEVEKMLENRVQDLTEKEKILTKKEHEVFKLQEEVRMKNEEIQRLKDLIRFKDDEFSRREQDILYREEKLDEEMRRIQEAKIAGGSVEQLSMKKNLESQISELSQKQEELAAKEKYLLARMEELRLKERGIIAEEIEKSEEERMQDLKTEKVKTGIARFDDLLFGGIPFGTNMLIIGPQHIGKDMFPKMFILEGLKKGVPAIWVITDKTNSILREELKIIVPSFEEYETMGLIKYIDTISVSTGDVKEDPCVIYIDNATDVDKISNVVDDVAKEFKEKHKYYKLAFESISTVIAYSSSAEIMKFLQPFCAKRKRDKTVAMYTIDRGIHDESTIQMITHIMDANLDLKIDNLKTMMCVRAHFELQHKGYIEYKYTPKSVTLGSWSLEMVR